MNEPHTYYETLITRYFSGEAGANEVVELSAWVKSDPAHQQLFKEYQKSWAMLEASHMEASDPASAVAPPIISNVILDTALLQSPCP